MLPVVIIAAGTASRMAPYSDARHKCFMELEPHITILDFVLEKVENIGSPRVLIVIRPSLRSQFEERLKVKAELVETEVEEFGNLYSVDLARKRLDNGSFLLLMCDHLFEQSIIDGILVHRSEAAFTVCVDRNPSRADLKEGLKLALKEGTVVNAGKVAPSRYGIDTGIILCHTSAGAYMEKAIESFGAGATIADALNMAAADGEVDYVDVTGKLWKDVDTPEDLVKARNIYWHILRKELSKPEDGLVSRYINRPISTRISLFAFRKRLNFAPITLTLTSFIVALLGSLLLAIRWFPFGGLLVQLSSIIDGVDGEIARLFHKATPWGGYLDSVLDRVSDVAIVAGLTLSSANTDGFILLLALVATANVILVSYVTHSLKSLGLSTEKLRKVPATRDVRLFAVFVASLLSLPIYGLYFLALAPIFYLGYSVALVFRTRRIEIKTESVRRVPKPEVTIEKKKLTSSIESLISNSIKLALALLIVSMITPAISGITLIGFDGFALGSDHVLSTISLIVIIYFGYRILLALKTIIDFLTKRLVDVVGITETTLKHILVDSLYLILAILLWTYLPPQFKQIPQIGEYASRLATLVIFAFFLLVLYDLAKLLYATFGEFYREIVERISKKLHESAQ